MELEKSGLDRNQKITTISNLHTISCNTSDSILNVIEKILSTGHRSLPVVSANGKVSGIITIMDVLNAFLRKQNMNDEISTIMSRDVIFCNPHDRLEYVLQKFKFSRRGRLPILEDGKLVGIVTERDFVKYFSEINFGKNIEELMTRKPFYMTVKNSALDCLKSMVNTRYRRLPIVDGKRLVGIENVTDVLRFLVQKKFKIEELKVPIGSIMIKNVYSINGNVDISNSIKIMKDKNIGGLPVVDNYKNLEGFITERDILAEIV